MELPDKPMRWQIIQYFIEKYNYKSWREIGYYKGWCFDNVKCDEKITIDPNPCKTPEQEQLPYRTISQLGENEVLVKETSDDYFYDLKKVLRQQVGIDHEYTGGDIYLVDGMHEYKQVYRDIENCLEFLNDGGVVLCHDILPPTKEHTTTGDKHGNWNGDCYKALLQFIQSDPFGNYTIRTLDTDWGIGIISKAPISLERMWSLDYNRAIEDWDYFDKNRNELLNVIDVEEFKKLY